MTMTMPKRAKSEDGGGSMSPQNAFRRNSVPHASWSPSGRQQSFPILPTTTASLGGSPHVRRKGDGGATSVPRVTLFAFLCAIVGAGCYGRMYNLNRRLERTVAELADLEVEYTLTKSEIDVALAKSSDIARLKANSVARAAELSRDLDLVRTDLDKERLARDELSRKLNVAIQDELGLREAREEADRLKTSIQTHSMQEVREK